MIVVCEAREGVEAKWERKDVGSKVVGGRATDGAEKEAKGRRKQIRRVEVVAGGTYRS